MSTRSLLLAAPLLAAPLLAVVLTACSAPAENQTTPVDADRAFAAVADPWAAPESVNLPSGQYGGSSLLRLVGERTRTFRGARGHEAMRAEVGAAEAAGWRLAGLACEDARTSSAVLARGTTPDDGMLAEVAAIGPEVTVSVSVAHHLDGSWPAYDAVAVTDTCVAGGGAGASLPEDLPFDALPGDAAEPSLQDYEPWRRESLSREEEAVLDEVSADPLLAEAGVDLSEPELREGDNWRSAISGGAEITVDAGSTGASVADVLARSGWDLTWTSCGAGLPVVATARLPLETATVTARLTSADPGTVTVSLGMPVPEAPLTYPPIEDVPVLESSPCLESGAVDEPLLLVGTPVAVPTRLHPYLAASG